jgi:hypothetical protein
MNMRINPLFLGLCLLARASFGGDAVASFAKQSLGLDLDSLSFGMTTNGEYGAMGDPLSPPPMVAAAGVSWMTNAASGKYNHDFPNRVLRYGFRDGGLVAVRVSIDTIVISGKFQFGTPEFDAARKELVLIQDELIKAKKTPKLKPNDSRFGIQYGAMCGSDPESLFLMEIEITPVEMKKGP